MKKLLGVLGLSFLLWFCTPQYCFAELHEITPTEPRQCYVDTRTMPSGKVWTVKIRAEANGNAWIFNDETFDPDYVLGQAASVCLQIPECQRRMEEEGKVEVALFLTKDQTCYLVVTFEAGAEL